MPLFLNFLIKNKRLIQNYDLTYLILCVNHKSWIMESNYIKFYIYSMELALEIFTNAKKDRIANKNF